MIYIVLISIVILYFTFAFGITPLLKKLFKVNMCPICGACMTTWIVLLLLKTFDVTKIENEVLAMLMGGTVIGMMFQLEKAFKGSKIKKFWIVRILMVTFGYLLVYAIVTEKIFLMGISLGFVISVIIIILFLYLSGKAKYKKSLETEKVDTDPTPVESKEYDAKKKEEEKKQNLIKSLENSLEDCC